MFLTAVLLAGEQSKQPQSLIRLGGPTSVCLCAWLLSSVCPCLDFFDLGDSVFPDVCNGVFFQLPCIHKAVFIIVKGASRWLS